MRVIVAFNPISGRGHAARMSGDIGEALLRAGVDVERMETSPGDPSTWLLPRMTGVDRIVVVGGDGTMRRVASALVGGDVPLYHAPSGTENLFAKSMHMSASPDDVVAAITGGKVLRIDTATANGAFLLLMASMGYDAAVVADLARHRSGSITHWSYALPMLRQLLGFKSPRLTIDVDGERIVDDRRGWVVVANSPAYAKGLNPARHASVTDGLLDVVFLPVKKRSDIIWWMGKLMRGTHLDHSGVISRQGEDIVIASDEPAVWQLDGDPSPDAEGTRSLDVRIVPASLPIITTTCRCQ